MIFTQLLSRNAGSEDTNEAFKLTTEKIKTTLIDTSAHSVPAINIPNIASTINVTTNKFNESSSIVERLTGIGPNTTDLIMTPSIVSALMENDSDDKPAHRVALTILIAVFMFISLVLSVGVIMFCKKKNSVFMLQKCEQDSELEMDDINTEVETSDSEYENIDSPRHIRHVKAETYPCLSMYVNENSIETPGSKMSKNRYKSAKNGLTSSPSAMPLLQHSKTGTETGQNEKLLKSKRHSDSQLLSHSSNRKQTGLLSSSFNQLREKRFRTSQTSSKQSKNCAEEKDLINFSKPSTLKYSKSAQNILISRNRPANNDFSSARVMSPDSDRVMSPDSDYRVMSPECDTFSLNKSSDKCEHDRHSYTDDDPSIVQTEDQFYDSVLFLTDEESTIPLHGHLEIL